MAITKKIIPIAALRDNYIWMLLDDHSKKAWVVDPGDAQPVIRALKQYQVTLAGVLLTHHHADHAGGIEELIQTFGNIIVYGSHFSTIPWITHPVKNAEICTAFSSEVHAIEIPGHTLDHIAYYGNQIVFCGDTLFSAGCGRIFEGTPAQMHDSLCKLSRLPDNTQIYCGHEYTLSNLLFAQTVEPLNPDILNKIEVVQHQLKQNKCTLPSLMLEEKKINPFLRCHMPDVIQSVESHIGRVTTSVIDVFQNLREWKNNFITS